MWLHEAVQVLLRAVSLESRARQCTHTCSSVCLGVGAARQAAEGATQVGDTGIAACAAKQCFWLPAVAVVQAEHLHVRGRTTQQGACEEGVLAPVSVRSCPAQRGLPSPRLATPQAKAFRFLPTSEVSLLPHSFSLRPVHFVDPLHQLGHRRKRRTFAARCCFAEGALGSDRRASSSTSGSA